MDKIEQVDTNIEDTSIETTKDIIEDYDDEPVSCCSECLSLISETKVIYRKGHKIEIDYCPHCLNTDFIELSIEEWEKKFEEKYNINFLKTKKSWKEIMEEQKKKLL